MKVLLVHPSCLMYSEVYLRLEPLGVELVAAGTRKAGHEVRVLDLQIFKHEDYFRELGEWKPEAVGFSLNYLANIPEVVDLARETRRRAPGCFVFAGGHSASFTAKEILEHAAGAIDCVVRGEGELITPKLLERRASGSSDLSSLPGIVTLNGSGPHPEMVDNLDRIHPARDLMQKRRKYFIGHLDPCASIEFARGCPWDCSFCSAWTFYGRSYRKVSPEAAGDDLASIREPNVFIVDDVAFIYPDHGYAIAKEIEKRRIRKKFYLETRGDVLLRNKDLFKYWKKLGLEFMFLGLESIDEEGLKAHRKRITLSKNFEALEFARSLGIVVAVNIISDPGWDKRRFEVIREWALSVPEVVHLTVNTPYPGTETWLTESRKVTTRDYRLFDVQHAVLPTQLPLDEFYRELVATQQVLNKKHMGFAALRDTFLVAVSLVARGRTNFIRMLWKFNQVYNPERQVRDHHRDVRYPMRPPETVTQGKVDLDTLFVHRPQAVAPATQE
jgi:hopanoid C-3 methylase HpnR